MVDVPALSSSIFARKQAAMVLSSLLLNRLPQLFWPPPGPHFLQLSLSILELNGRVLDCSSDPTGTLNFSLTF